MKHHRKLGFTVVELVVVIAAVAVLAAVLIPTFSGLIERAKMSADAQLVKNVNTALAAAGAADGKNTCMHDAISDIAEAGYDLAKLSFVADSHLPAWDQESDRIVYLEYDPEKAHSPDGLWLIATTPDEVKAFAEAGFHIYLADGVIVPEGTIFRRGIDVGNNKWSIRFSTDDEVDVIIRTNGGTLTVDAPNATVKHYGDADNVVIENETNSYHELGTVVNKSDEKDEGEESVGSEETVTDEDKPANEKTETVSTAEALNAAVADPEVTRIVLAADIELSDPLNITRDVTLDGGGHKLSTSDSEAAARTINIGYNPTENKMYDNISVTLCNLTVAGPETAEAGRGVNIGGKHNCVNIINSTVTCGYYAIYVIHDNTEGLHLKVEKSNVTALSVLSICSNDHVIEITESTLTGSNNRLNVDTGFNDFGTISFEAGLTFACNSSVTISNCTVNVQSTGGSQQWLVAFQYGRIVSSCCKAEFTNCTIHYENEHCIPLYDGGSENVLIIDGNTIKAQN